jgi:hypothetical protein
MWIWWRINTGSDSSWLVVCVCEDMCTVTDSLFGAWSLHGYRGMNVCRVRRPLLYDCVSPLTVDCTVMYTLYCVLFAVCTVYCVLYCVLCTVYCTVYCVLCTVYCVLCTVYCVLCTVYCVA